MYKRFRVTSLVSLVFGVGIIAPRFHKNFRVVTERPIVLPPQRSSKDEYHLAVRIRIASTRRSRSSRKGAAGHEGRTTALFSCYGGTKLVWSRGAGDPVFSHSSRRSSTIPVLMRGAVWLSCRRTGQICV